MTRFTFSREKIDMMLVRSSTLSTTLDVFVDVFYSECAVFLDVFGGTFLWYFGMFLVIFFLCSTMVIFVFPSRKPYAKSRFHDYILASKNHEKMTQQIQIIIVRFEGLRSWGFEIDFELDFYQFQHMILNYYFYRVSTTFSDHFMSHDWLPCDEMIGKSSCHDEMIGKSSRLLEAKLI